MIFPKKQIIKPFIKDKSSLLFITTKYIARTVIKASTKNKIKKKQEIC